MYWKKPPIIKIYEALGALADNRVSISGNKAKVHSSTWNKHYDVEYDPVKREIMSNDNGSYWQGYLGYPAIAFLMKKGTLSYDSKIAFMLRGIKWKDINQKFGNNFEKTLEYILSKKSDEERMQIQTFTDRIYNELMGKNFGILGKKKSPPAGY